MPSFLTLSKVIALSRGPRPPLRASGARDEFASRAKTASCSSPLTPVRPGKSRRKSTSEIRIQTIKRPEMVEGISPSISGVGSKPSWI